MHTIVLERIYNKRKKSSGLLFFMILILLSSCKTEEQNIVLTTVHYQGRTMGTTYSIKYEVAGEKIAKSDLDSILMALNDEVSTYIPSSIISILNESEQAEFKVTNDLYFKDNYNIVADLYKITDGYFDASLAPLVNFWGFGYTDKDMENKDRAQVPKMMAYVGFEKWSAVNDAKDFVISKPIKGKLDFSASAKGYGVDLLAEYFEGKGVSSYYVEIGGELRVKGVKPMDGSGLLV